MRTEINYRAPDFKEMGIDKAHSEKAGKQLSARVRGGKGIEVIKRNTWRVKTEAEMKDKLHTWSMLKLA
ncbi:hypothetical protein AOLI_G00325670 [Acnodon oligacanthus]